MVGEERGDQLLVLQLGGQDGAAEHVVEEQVRQHGLVPLQLLYDWLGKALKGLVTGREHRERSCRKVSGNGNDDDDDDDDGAVVP